MVSDTLQFVASNAQTQQLIALLQGLMLVIGALTSLFSRKK